MIVLLLDGLTDWPCRDLGGATPLEAADTPNLDRIATEGATGLCYPLGPGRAPSSERAQWRYLGYDDAVFPGRAILEAAGVGIHVAPGVVSTNLALRTAEREGGYLRLVGGYVGAADPDAASLLDSLDGMAVDDFAFAVRHTQRAEALLTIVGARASASAALSDADPLSSGDLVHRVEPLEEAADPLAARRTAAALNGFLRKAHRVLDEHPLNQRRRAGGLPPLNAAVTKWTGRLRPVLPLAHNVGGPAVVIASTALYGGLAQVLGAEARHVPEQEGPSRCRPRSMPRSTPSRAGRRSSTSTRRRPMRLVTATTPRARPRPSPPAIAGSPRCRA
ncbi:MAG: hypothetical protein H0V19_00150, partial [Euzebyales bacterium]|nr:hypothetical protein [Euzebyales bacterium]